MVTFSCPEDEAGSTVKDFLDLIEEILWNTGKENVTVI